MSRLSYQIPNFTYPQTRPQEIFDKVVAQAKAAEAAGFDRVMVMDHFYQLPMLGKPDEPMFECYTMLSALAQHTKRVRLSALVTGNTYRNPALLAKTITTLDHVSHGRATLGIGAGWFEQEHKAYGIPFPKEKFSRLEEQLAVVTGLWQTKPGDTFDFHGAHYDLTDSPALPKPAQSRIPVLIGGHGASRTPKLAAKYADEFNIPFASVEDSERQFARVRAAAEEAGRKGDDLVYSNALVVCVGKDDQEVARRAAAIGREVDELKANGLAGTPSEVVDKIGRYAAVGASRLYLQVLDLDDLDHLELISAQVQSQLS